MIVLSLQDQRQDRINSGAKVEIWDRLVFIRNNHTEFLINSGIGVGIVAGTYWLDRDFRSVQLLLYSGVDTAFTYELILGDKFFELFPEASDWWGDYFFRLHYSQR